MRFQFLPHYFKYIGLALFITGIPYMFNEFASGWNSVPGAKINLILPMIWPSKINQVITLTSYLIYAFAKDRVFDEFIAQVRMESVYLVFFGSLIFILFRLLIKSDWEMSAVYLFEVQVLVYFVINKIRKIMVTHT